MNGTAGDTQASILLVDDEPNLLEGLARQLHREYRVVTAIGGFAGQDALVKEGPFAVVVSDMRMPKVDGVAMLAFARREAPDTVRLLLTGQADLKDAVAVVNQGQVFRFLTKPCAPDVLRTAIEDAVTQHRLITSEKTLLRETLQGSVRMLLDLLSAASPEAFARAQRVARLVVQLGKKLSAENPWEAELAALLLPLGLLLLPGPLADRLHRGASLTPAEQREVERLPGIAAGLLARIPRLEGVRGVLLLQVKRDDAAADEKLSESVRRGAKILKAAGDYELLRSQGTGHDVAIQRLHSKGTVYDPLVLERLAERDSAPVESPQQRPIELCDLQVGMVLAQHVRAKSGALLVAHGQELTTSLVERLRSLSAGVGVQLPIWVEANVQRAAVQAS